VDERRLRMDFMPYLERTVQPYGILIDQIAYYSDVLRRWVNPPTSASSPYSGIRATLV
jgi:putative transposase